MIVDITERLTNYHKAIEPIAKFPQTGSNKIMINFPFSAKQQK